MNYIQIVIKWFIIIIIIIIYYYYKIVFVTLTLRTFTIKTSHYIEYSLLNLKHNSGNSVIVER